MAEFPYENPVLEIAKKHTNRVPVFPWHFKKEQILAASINYIPVILIRKKKYLKPEIWFFVNLSTFHI